MFMDTQKALSIEEIHNSTLDIVKRLSDICEILNINYYVAYGSLIGAIRHKGFIPWDDDFDVIMMRPDYDKFIDYCKNNEKKLSPFKLLNREVCVDYPYTISRFEDMRYKAVYDSVTEYDSGMFVDIYPFDGAGSDEKKTMRKIAWRKRILAKCVDWSIKKNYASPKGKKIIKSFFKYIGFKATHIIGKDFFLNQYEKLGTYYSFDQSSLVGCLCWDGDCTLFNKSLFGEALTLPFETLEVKVPVGYDEILKKLYGEYMKLPPEKDRIPTHEYTLYRRKEY
mgnify:CR=1 FL=1